MNETLQTILGVLFLMVLFYLVIRGNLKKKRGRARRSKTGRRSRGSSRRDHENEPDDDDDADDGGDDGGDD